MYSQLVILSMTIFAITSYRKGDHFITFNTSGAKQVASTSLATNINTPFSVYLPLFFDKQQPTVQFTPNIQIAQLEITPALTADSYRLYNQYSNGQFWYAFRKQFSSDAVNTIGTFAFSKITVEGQTSNYLLPLFKLPLSMLNFKSFYKCDDVLISYQKTGKLIDVVVFSYKESFNLTPKAKWGFKHKDQKVNLSRQTYELGTEIQVDVGQNKYCILNQSLGGNSYELVEQPWYDLQELLQNYSTQLELMDKKIQQQL